MRSIHAVGFDMDYTLVHYEVSAWEERAFHHTQRLLASRGVPVTELHFDPAAFTRGLIIDTKLGNIVKANRFGYVTKAAHGMRMMPHDLQRKADSQVWVDLSDSRWIFLNTLFSLSEACLYAQIVDMHDRGALLPSTDYQSIYRLVSDAMNSAHLEGALKADIIADPDRFVVRDPELPRALLDLKHSGKKLFLVTNSEWHYTLPMMSWAFDRHLPSGSWRDLFDLVIVQSRKPSFFDGKNSFDEVLDDSGATRPLAGPLQKGRSYRGGNAQLVQEWLELLGEEILYVGDHVYADVHVSSQIHRWRTALIIRELEAEVAAETAFAQTQKTLHLSMQKKDFLDQEQAALRLALQRLEYGELLPLHIHGPASTIHERLRTLRIESTALDAQLAPLAKASGELGNTRWGPLMRAGNDKSRLARQIERHADVYTGRVANLLHLTPFGYLRAARGSLPHDAS